jgi:hypothetical protein
VRNRRLLPVLLLVGSLGLFGCGAGDDHAPPAGVGSGAVRPDLSENDKPVPAADPITTPKGEGVLDLVAHPGPLHALGPLRYVVTDAQDQVVAGGDSDQSELSGADASDRGLSVMLPAGSDFNLRLTSTSAEPHPTSCSASVGSFAIEADAVAHFQVFVWHCADAELPSTVVTPCYWLADWVGVTRTEAAVGELIDVSAAGHDFGGNPANFSWSTASPARGAFMQPGAAQTSFRCQAAGKALPLSVQIDDGECQKTVTQTVSCL